MWTQATTIYDAFSQAAYENPRSLALAFEDERCTYSELEKLSIRVADGLIRLPVVQRDRVGIFMHNSVEMVATLLAASAVGAALVPLNTRMRGQELRQVVDTHRLSVLITHEKYDTADKRLLARIDEALGTGDDSQALHQPPPVHLVTDVISDGGPTQDAVTAVRERQRQVRVRDIAIVLPTSGTTSTPKGCVLTHEAFVRPATEMARTRFGLGPTDRLWDPLPLFHLGGLTPLVACLSAGTAWIGLRHFDADEGIRQLVNERCTMAYPVFEPLWVPIVEHPDFKHEHLHLREVHVVGTPERMTQYQQAHPRAAVTNPYGTSEGAPASYTTTAESIEKRLTTHGRAAPGTELKILDPDGDECPTGTEGEIVYRGYQCFEGHFVDGEITSSLLDEEGWLHSSDRGYLDADGYLYYTGRIKDMLKVGGENVAAAEIEGILLQLPGVRIAQVVAAPDPKYSEVAAAFIELESGASLSEEIVIGHCEGRIAKFKIPRYVRFVDGADWPMSATKIQKAELRRWIAESLAETGAPAPS